MGVIKLPESFRNLLISPKFADVFTTMGLTRISKLPLNEIDIPRVFEMMENLTEGGLTQITDLMGRVTATTLTEEIVSEALHLPITNYPVRERRAHANLGVFFENPKKTGNTYTQMKSAIMADHIHIIQHIFKLPKQQRHTVPDIAFIHAVDDGMTRKINVKKNWS